MLNQLVIQSQKRLAQILVFDLIDSLYNLKND